MMRCVPSVLTILAAVGVIWQCSVILGAEPTDEPNRPTRVVLGGDSFDAKKLDGAWFFDDPNGNDALSLTARPGWLRIHVRGSGEDMWAGGRGFAPILRRSVKRTSGNFSLQTYADLATANGDYPVLNSIGGLVVCDSGDPPVDRPFLLTLGLQHNLDGGTEVILQKPGHSFKWASPGANAVHLRLDRNVDEGNWAGFYKNHVHGRWTLLATVKDEELNAGKIPDILDVGLFAKTWDAELGGPANIDFAYFGEPEPAATGVSTVDAASKVADSPEANAATLKSFCVSGKERNVLNGYREAELLRHSGKGCLTHMWFGGDWPGYDQTRIRIYVDGQRDASIDMELGLGHGCGFGDDAAPWGGAKLGKTGHPSGFYNTYKIPFGTEIRVTAQRAENSPDGAPFWWIVRGTENLPVRIAGVRLPDRARLKLHQLSDHVVKPFEEFALCDVKGSGALYQVTMAADGLRDAGDWTDISYLEAIVRAYIDGQSRPLELSSGLEDYFLGTYYFNRGRYANDLAGLTHLDQSTSTFSAYRFHDEDPIFFQTGLRLTCRCGEEIAGKKLHDPPETRYTTYTWVYQW